MGLHLLLGWGDQRGAEVPNQALGWERDNCCRVSSGTESGSGGMPHVNGSSLPVL